MSESVESASKALSKFTSQLPAWQQDSFDQDLPLVKGGTHEEQYRRVRQARALIAITKGEGMATAAEAAGVDRRTLHRWMTQDAGFVAALDRWRQQTRIEAEDDLLQLSKRALGCVGLAMNNGNLTAALAVLRGVGLLSGKPAGAPGGGQNQPQAGNNVVMEIQQAVVMNSGAAAPPEDQSEPAQDSK